jgi:hypothetical protein
MITCRRNFFSARSSDQTKGQLMQVNMKAFAARAVSVSGRHWVEITEREGSAVAVFLPDQACAEAVATAITEARAREVAKIDAGLKGRGE